MEAKISTYETSSVPVTDGKPDNGYRGFASNINIQLALKKRFVDALKSWKENFSTDHKKIKEDPVVIDKYGDTYPRALAKKSLVNFCINEFLGADVEYYYVSLTNDEKHFLLFGDDSKKAHYPPLGLNHEWDNFGCLTYSSIEELPWISNSHLYKQSKALTDKTVSPVVHIPITNCKTLNGKTPKLSKWDLTESFEIAKTLIRELPNYVSEIKDMKWKQNHTSFSLATKRSSNVFLEILPIDMDPERVLFAVANDLIDIGDFVSEKVERRITIHKRTFNCYLYCRNSSVLENLAEFIRKLATYSKF